MMILFTDEQNELYDKLDATDDPEEIKKIYQRLDEISREQREKYKDCPFVH